MRIQYSLFPSHRDFDDGKPEPAPLPNGLRYINGVLTVCDMEQADWPGDDCQRLDEVWAQMKLISEQARMGGG